MKTSFKCSRHEQVSGAQKWLMCARKPVSWAGEESRESGDNHKERGAEASAWFGEC